MGPTLGATITLASQGQDLAHATLVMAIFGIGASAPLIVFGMLSRQAMMKFRDKMLAAVLNIAPVWLIQLTTSI